VGHGAPGGWVRDAHKRLFFVALGQRQVVATRAVDGTYFALRVAELAGLKKDNLDWQGHRVMVYCRARHGTMRLCDRRDKKITPTSLSGSDFRL